MRSAGEVKESINVAPAQQGVALDPRRPRPPAQSARRRQNQAAEPERRCFTVKTAKGVATRCNDTPEDTDK